MALVEQDIFPLSTTQGTASSARLLEPFTCSKELYMPTTSVFTEARLPYYKRISHPYYMFKYEYKDIMTWEYLLIEEFFKRMKGRYELFYAVDWSAPYRILGVGANSITVDRIFGLSDSTGYGGNLLLLYNAIKSGTNKQILTITDATTTTLTVSEAVDQTLANSGAKVYVLYTVTFDIDKIQGTGTEVCMQRNVINFPGYGNHSLFGLIMSVTVPLIQMGVLK